MPSRYDPFRGFPLLSRLLVRVQDPRSLQQQRTLREAILCHICLNILATLAQLPAQWVTLDPESYPLPQHLKVLGLYHDAVKVWPYLPERDLFEQHQTVARCRVRLITQGWSVVAQVLEVLPEHASA